MEKRAGDLIRNGEIILTGKNFCKNGKYKKMSGMWKH